MTKDGGPAFPVTTYSTRDGKTIHEATGFGMTLRDYFIAHAPAEEIDGMVPPEVGACAKYLGIPKYENEKHYLLLIAKARCQWADAMLAERDK